MCIIKQSLFCFVVRPPLSDILMFGWPSLFTSTQVQTIVRNKVDIDIDTQEEHWIDLWLLTVLTFDIYHTHKSYKCWKLQPWWHAQMIWFHSPLFIHSPSMVDESKVEALFLDIAVAREKIIITNIEIQFWKCY